MMHVVWLEEAVNDLNSVGKVLVGEVPDPLGPIAEHGLARRAIEAAPRGLALDARRELARRRVSVLVRRAFDRRRVADRARHGVHRQFV